MDYILDWDSNTLLLIIWFSERGVGMYNLYHCLKMTFRRGCHMHHGVVAIIGLYEFHMVVMRYGVAA